MQMCDETTSNGFLSDGAPGGPSQCDAMVRMLGIRCEPAGNGRTVTTVEASGDHCNVHGFVHGVVLFAMADIGMGWMLDRHIGSAKRITTLTLTSNFVSPVRRGLIVAETSIVRVGNTVATLQTTVRDSRGADRALFTGIFHMTEGKRDRSNVK